MDGFHRHIECIQKAHAVWIHSSESTEWAKLIVSVFRNKDNGLSLREEAGNWNGAEGELWDVVTVLFLPMDSS